MKKKYIVSQTNFNLNNARQIYAHPFDTQEAAIDFAKAQVNASANQAQHWAVYEMTSVVRPEKQPLIVEPVKATTQSA